MDNIPLVFLNQMFSEVPFHSESLWFSKHVGSQEMTMELESMLNCSRYCKISRFHQPKAEAEEAWSFSILWKPDFVCQISKGTCHLEISCLIPVFRTAISQEADLSPLLGAKGGVGERGEGLATPSQCLSPPSVFPSFHFDNWKDDSDKMGTAPKDKNNVKCRDWELINQTGHGV